MGGAYSRPRPHQAPPPAPGPAPRRRGGKCQQGAVRGRGAPSPVSGGWEQAPRSGRGSDCRLFVRGVLRARVSEENPVRSYGVEAGRRVYADIIGLSLLITE